MKRLRPWIIGGLIGAFALVALPLSGLLPHGATGPAGVAGWYHALAGRQSVTLRGLSASAPPLDDRTMAARAAGHYEMVCATCHGSPAAAPARFAADLWPEPPLLTAGHWRSPGYQFAIIRHGLRQTAMPGWPAPDRTDEIWDMVAFLRALPGLSAADYRAMAGKARCTDCHGAKGQGRDGIPRLDIQTPDYISAALRSYRNGTRQSGTMQAAAHLLTDDEIAALALRFGQQRELRPGADGLGSDLAQSGSPRRDIPACLSCHGPQARVDYPRLIGQDGRYLFGQLMLFRDLGPGRGGPHATVMAPIAAALKEEEIAALTQWLAGSPPP